MLSFALLDLTQCSEINIFFTTLSYKMGKPFFCCMCMVVVRGWQKCKNFNSGLKNSLVSVFQNILFNSIIKYIIKVFLIYFHQNSGQLFKKQSDSWSNPNMSRFSLRYVLHQLFQKPNIFNFNNEDNIKSKIQIGGFSFPISQATARSAQF